MSDLENIDLHWDHSHLNMNAVFRPGIEALFSVSTSNNFEMSSVVGNPTLIDEEDKENSPPTTSKSGRPTEHPKLLICRFLEVLRERFLFLSIEHCSNVKAQNAVIDYEKQLKEKFLFSEVFFKN